MMAQMFEPYLQYKPVDNFDLSLNISEPAEPSPPPSRSSPIGHSLARSSTNHGLQLHFGRDHGASYGSDNNNMADQTFHTPSFGDEDFDLAPPSLGALQSPPQSVVSHQMHQIHQHPQSQASPQPQHHPNNAQQEGNPPSSGTGNGPSEASAPPPPNSSSSISHLELNYRQMAHPQQQQQQQQSQQQQSQHQQQHQQQQHQQPPPTYGPRSGEIMYMQPPPPPMPQPQRMPHQIQMAPQHHNQVVYDPARYPNMAAMNNHMQQQQHIQQHLVYGNQMHMMRPPQMMHLQQTHQMGHHPMGPGSAGSGSPPNSNHTSSPGLETGSEDSDDCGPFSQMMGGLKRPSPEPMDPSPNHPTMQQQQQQPQQQAGSMTASNNSPPGKAAAGSKKAKVQKKKKKKDPNEPQKPVSAYALFFRDTQAAIKGQNPNASFGEVSKIVASMWDTLDADHKNIYKRKTEAAKKEYLKALAAYRASLVSKAASDQSDSIYGSHPVALNNNSPPSGHHQQQQQQQQQQHINSGSGGLSPLQKKSPLLTSLMEGGGGPGAPVQAPNPGNNPNMYMNNGSNSPNSPPVHQGNSQGQMGQVWNMHPSINPSNMGGQQSQNQQQQQQQQGHMMPIMHSGSMRTEQPVSQHATQQQQQQTTGNHEQQHQGNGNTNNQQSSTTANSTNTASYTPNYLGGQQANNSGGDGNSSVGSGGGNQENYRPPPAAPSAPVTQAANTQRCLRSGCTNPAVDSPDWDREYCSNDCVVSHCRDVFTNWVTARQESAANVNFASVK